MVADKSLEEIAKSTIRGGVPQPPETAYEYKVVPTHDGREVKNLLDLYSAQGWEHYLATNGVWAGEQGNQMAPGITLWFRRRIALTAEKPNFSKGKANSPARR